MTTFLPRIRFRRAHIVYLLSSITFLLISAVIAPANLYATTIIVTETIDDDPDVDNGQCSLREAISAANTNLPVDSCLAGASGLDTIRLTAGETYVLTIAGDDEDANATGDLDVLEPLIIESTVEGTPATIDANDIDRVLNVPNGSAINSAEALSLTDIVVQNGTAVASSTDDGGGGILVKRGGLTLLRSTVTNNAVTNSDGADGGGILVHYDDTGLSGTILINDSTISDNTVVDQGGGIVVDSATATPVLFNITNSTISNNVAADDGGGIYPICGTDQNIVLTITNSTISGNTAAEDGGGLFIFHTTCEAIISYSTIANNSATNGGGIDIATSSEIVNVFSSIIADNTATGVGPDCNARIDSTNGHNVIENITGCDLRDTTTNNVTGSDPALGPLADNGGPTLTHMPSGTSNALELIADGTAGCDAGVSVDQRNAVRADGANRGDAACDAGAVEGDSAETRTAITLQSLSAQSLLPHTALLAGLLLLLIGTAWLLWQKRPS